MIDGTLVSQGDTVRNYTVVEIATKWVVLEKDGAKYTLLVGDTQ